MNNKDNFEEYDEEVEVKEGRYLTRWTLEAALFLQREKEQLVRLDKLQNDAVNFDFNDVSSDLNEKIDDQLYKVYLDLFDNDILRKHNLTKSRECFDSLMYIAPEDIERLLMRDDHYIECHSF